jgi:hypothetical protein
VLVGLRARSAGRAALDAVPEAYHNPVAVWWGAFAAFVLIGDQVVIGKPVAGVISPTTSVAGAHIRASQYVDPIEGWLS